MGTNNYLTFCPTDTGSNLLSQGDYAAATDRTNGNQPGVASSKLVNKAIRQSSFITSQLAQYLADQSAINVLDDGNAAKLLLQMTGLFRRVAPSVTRLTSGSGTMNLIYAFTIEEGSAEDGATYTNNSVTFTVVGTVASSTLIKMSGSGAPEDFGTLTKASGTGDATLTFVSVKRPSFLRVMMVGAGGGGGGSGTSGGTSGGTGGNTTFGTSLLTAAGGVGGGVRDGAASGIGGNPTVNSPALAVLSVVGGSGGSGQYQQTGDAALKGGDGGNSFLGGAGGGGLQNNGSAGATNTGGGGAGGGQVTNATARTGGAGGGGGAYIEALIENPGDTYAYTVGAAGTAGTAGTNGYNGTAGGSGLIVVEQHYA